MADRVRWLIVGGGPTGLGAARRLCELGEEENTLLIERQQSPGGLASSTVDARGFTWDIGGHVQFSHYEYFDQAMDELLGRDGWLSHERESWVWLKGRFVPYPFQNNVRLLPTEDAERCLHGLVDVAASPPKPASNFADWMSSRFGDGICDVFLRPYNFKVWAHPPELMNATWVGERVAQVDLKRVISNVLNARDDVSWGPNKTFRFPKHGGTGAIWQACADALPAGVLSLGRSVVAIDLNSRSATLCDGSSVKYDSLISTMPLTELVKVANAPEQFQQAAIDLLWSSTHVVGIGLNGAPPEHLKKKCWMYFPEGDCPFYRVTVFSNYSPNNVPSPASQWSLMAEVSESGYKPVDHGTLVEDVIRGAEATGLIADRSSIVSTWHRFEKFGYPIPSLRRDDALGALIPFFDQHGILSRGRFGAWKYEVSNQDHSFMQGVEAAERLVNSRPEITAFDPDYANSKKHPWPFERWAA